jgi:hypothetical protein
MAAVPPSLFLTWKRRSAGGEEERLSEALADPKPIMSVFPSPLKSSTNHRFGPAAFMGTRVFVKPAELATLIYTQYTLLEKKEVAISVFPSPLKSPVMTSGMLL